MGYNLNHAIVVTSEFTEQLNEAVAVANELELQVLGPSEPAINNCSSILICPDGSKEGWAASDLGNIRRAKFIKYLEGQRNDDGSSYLTWVEVSYDYNDEFPKIINSSYLTK